MQKIQEVVHGIILGSDDGANDNAGMVAYCFSEVKGYSKFGTYTGNGSSDGSFIYTGFKPAWVLVKNAADAHDWHLFDNKRLGINPANERLNPNGSGAAVGSDDAFDFLSNGFKNRSGSSARNHNGQKIFYMAFAQSPFVASNNVAGTAG